MLSSICRAAIAACFVSIVWAQQYAGDAIVNTLLSVPGSAITYFRIQDPAGKNNNLTLTNYYSLGENGQRK